MTRDDVERIRRECDEPGWVRELCDLALSALSAERELAQLRKALSELVVCKDLKERLDAVDPMNWKPEPWEEDVRAEYERRKGPAWDAARAALGSVPVREE